jgi:hypothetical protein
MSDDDTRPIGPDEPPLPPPEPPLEQPADHPTGQPSYAMPVPSGPVPSGYYPAYAQQRPRFADQVLGMRAVIAVAVACLLIGGLSGFILGRASASGEGGFERGPMMSPYGGAQPQQR